MEYNIFMDHRKRIAKDKYRGNFLSFLQAKSVTDIAKIPFLEISVYTSSLNS